MIHLNYSFFTKKARLHLASHNPIVTSQELFSYGNNKKGKKKSYWSSSGYVTSNKLSRSLHKEKRSNFTHRGQQTTRICSRECTNH